MTQASTAAAGYSLAELLIVAASEAWRGNGEILASGIGVVPRLGAGLAKLTHSPELLMTDSECFLVEEPIPLVHVASTSPSTQATCHSTECSNVFGAAVGTR